MTDEQREAVADALRGGDIVEEPGSEGILEDIIAEDVDSLEPVIDGFIQDERREFLAILLEMIVARGRDDD